VHRFSSNGTDIQIQDRARRHGFSGVSHFRWRFRQQFGASRRAARPRSLPAPHFVRAETDAHANGASRVLPSGRRLQAGGELPQVETGNQLNQTNQDQGVTTMNRCTSRVVATQYSTTRAVRLIIAGCAALAAAPGLCAQAERNSSTTTLDEVVVTAQYQRENLSKTPISITVISSDDLERNNVQQLDEILNDVPGVKLSRGPQGSFFNIRGISTIQGGGEIDPGMSFNVDGIYNPFSSAALMSFYDVDRVEVLRGPQGTLYGRNAISGVVNVVTRDPELEDFSANARVSVGNFNARTVLAAVNLPLGDRLAARLVGNYQDHDGYMTANHDDLNTKSGRGKLLFQATDNVRLGFTFDYGLFRGAGIGLAKVNPFASNPWETLPDLVPPWQRTEAVDYAGLVQWDAGPVTLTYIPAYKSNDWDNQATNGTFVAKTSIHDIQNTQELRVASNDTDSRLQWQAGAFYYDARNRQNLNFSVITILQQVITNSKAVFAQANYSINDKTRATVGVRYTNDKKSEDGKNYFGTMLNGQVDDSHSSWNSWTYKLGLERDVLDASMVYANVSTGFKAGGVSLSAGPSASFDPEKLTAYQAGMKSRLLDDRLSINTELYYYDYSNYQAAYTSLDPNFGGFIRIVSNAGAAKIHGAEVESSFKVTSNDLLSGSIAYIDGHFGTYVVPDGNGGTFDYSGSDINAPHFQISASYRRFFSLGDRGRISPSVTAYYRSGGYLDKRVYGPTSDPALVGMYANPYSHQDSFTKLDAAVSWQSPSERMQVTAFANNLTNKATATSAFRGQSLPYTYGYVESPRTYGVSVDVSFK
jgi:iron complex outermembrane receptor protein